MDKTCGNCACHEIDDPRDMIVKCNGDITVYGWKDRRDGAAKCPYYRPKYPDKHLVMQKIVATYFLGYRDPFYVAIHCTDGHAYRADSGRIMQARCAGWKSVWRSYAEDGEQYKENVWTGSGLPVVVSDDLQIR